jgi:hypothetical protein
MRSRRGSTRSNGRWGRFSDDDYHGHMSTSREPSPYIEKAALERALRETEAEREQAKRDFERARQKYLESRERLRKLSR